MITKKGFGGFIIVVILFSAAIISYISESRKADDGFASMVADQHALGRLAILKNSIVKSHCKLNGNAPAAWNFEVQSQLAKEYGMNILIDGSKVNIADNEHSVRSEFYLR